MASELPEELPDECCAKCRFSDFLYELDDAVAVPRDLYQCRRFPPTFVRSRPNEDVGGEPEVAMTPSVEDIYTFSFWRHPRTTTIDWCGEFQPRKAEAKPDRPEQADMSLTYAKFPNRSRQALERRGVTMVSELCALTESDVRGFYLVGDKIIEEIRATLAKLGKSLKGEPPPTSPA